MVELLVDRLEDRLDLGEVANPAGIGIDLAFDIDGNAERMAMQAAAFVAFRDCLLYTSPSPRDLSTSRMPSSA